MKKKSVFFIMALSTLILSGCSSEKSSDISNENFASSLFIDENNYESVTKEPVAETLINQLEKGLSSVKFTGDDYFEEFLKTGASSDNEVMEFLMTNLEGADNLSVNDNIFGCSTISVKSPDDEQLFGRNFDWNKCNALIVQSEPDNGYSSVSTVNTDFISGADISSLPDKTQALISLYAPLDGMNEKGLCVSVNMISDYSSTINQETDKPDITTTTVIRLLLNQAENVDDAVRLLESYDIHASMGVMVHFAIADADGKSIAVEFVDNKMSVIDTRVLTNFYLTEGNKYGIGTEQSHERFERLTDTLGKNPQMTEDEVKNVLDSVSKDNFSGFESTEWSIVFNQTKKTATYYHRENYDKYWTFSLN